MRFGHASGLLLSSGVFLVSLFGCGGGETPPAKSANDEETPREHADRPSMSASADIGALDEGKVTQTFHGAQGSLEKCLAAGAGRNELEGGDIAFLVKIGKDGRVVHAHAEKSTLGDRETEKCMLDALRHRSWPEPQGGDLGLARNSFGFDMPNDARPPTAWEASRVQETLGSLSGKIASCKHRTRGDLTATVYVDPEGSAVSVGIASSDDSGEDAADCLVSVLKDAKYPSPGSWPAKVSFPL
jgi:hypothetical protein